MPSYSFKLPRLFMEAPLSEGADLALDKSQSNYLVNVLRRSMDDEVLVFNGTEGEWVATLTKAGKKNAILTCRQQTRPQTPPAQLDYLFAPLKHARLDYVVQKATEMGVGALSPVITTNTQVTRVNTDRMAANVTEACEQCGVLSVPKVQAPTPLTTRLSLWAEKTPDQPLIFCDERADGLDAMTVLQKIGSMKPVQAARSLGLLIGPEGGFTAEERRALQALAFVHTLPLGPRILRADTAAVAALTLIQATLGDW